VSLQASASQTVGPFFSIGMSWLYKSELFAGTERPRLTFEGRVLDGDGLPIVDALLELWQADGEGRYAQAQRGEDGEGGLRGFGRVATDEQGRYRFRTIAPGRVPTQAGEPQAPHINVLVLMRGLLRSVRTRIYLPDQPDNAHDPVLLLLPEARRPTLVAAAIGPARFSWDVHMQGQHETVFFDF